ncbi:MAG: hypothetical protein IAC23_06700 [Bacteroidetes bacterium]|uniref:BACON domain-containing protein n=1 Tax=Candidatus Cryptobacteroides merdavium TaxID=2840769 RepID=A0A9D9H8V1_9BACT|nr:hypothetical protein [Candidatus Cryptobacteroides merdavium]
MLVLAGCKKDPQEPVTPEEPDEISVAPASRTVGGEGGTATTKVTSSGDWTLTTSGDVTYDWVTADKTSGKNGETVTFTVEPNDKEDLTAEFLFVCGTADAKFTITSTKAEVKIPEIVLTSPAEVEVGYEAGEFTVDLALTNVEDVEDLDASADGNWVTFMSPAKGSDGTAEMTFAYEANEKQASREASITISYPNADPVTVTVTQAAAPAPEPEYDIELVTETPLEVEYTEGTASITVSISDGVDAASLTATSDQTWAKLQRSVGNGIGNAMMIFEYTANTAAEARTANITVQYDGVDYFTFQLVQAGDPNGGEQPGGGNYVADMRNHCASPELTYSANGDGKTMIDAVAWVKPDVLQLGKTATFEMLVKHDAEFITSGKWDGTWVNSMFGIEGRYLIRQGDNVANRKQWEFVWGGSVETKFRSEVDLPGDEWTHIAVVIDEKNNAVTLYQNGEVVASGPVPASAYDLDLSVSFDGWEQGQAFALGRSYDNSRDFYGEMAEVRIWNRALSQSEIKADGHFYSVDANASGLVAYWKMNEGEGDTFYDSTPNGNNLKGYYLTQATEDYSGVGKTGLDYWDFGISWVNALPEVPGFPRN